MLDETAFVQAIAANLEDDGPRLIFADFLEERGDPASIVRAEFIRVQCALASSANEPNLYEHLTNRERFLLETHWRAWLRPICQALGEPLPVASQRHDNGGPRERHSLEWLNTPRQTHMVFQPWAGRETAYFYCGQFRRGFMAHVALVAKPYRGVNHITRLVERSPIDGMTLIQFPMLDLCSTLEAAQPQNLRSLELLYPEQDSLRAITHIDGLQRLRELMIRSVRNGAEPLTAFLEGSSFPELKTLLFNSCEIEHENLDQFLQLPWVRSLERLEFVQCGFDDMHVHVLRRHLPHLALRSLDVSANLLTTESWHLLLQAAKSVLNTGIADRPWPQRFYL